MAFICIYF